MIKKTKHPRALHMALRAVGACSGGASKFRGLTAEAAFYDHMDWDRVRWLMITVPPSKAGFAHGAYSTINAMRFHDFQFTDPNMKRPLTDNEKLALFRRPEVFRSLQKALNAR